MGTSDMARRNRKGEILRNAGYIYRFDREIYFNRAAKKAFSVEFVEDHTEAELQQCIAEDTRDKEWTFYFNSEPFGSVKRELATALG